MEETRKKEGEKMKKKRRIGDFFGEMEKIREKENKRTAWYGKITAHHGSSGLVECFVPCTRTENKTVDGLLVYWSTGLPLVAH